MRVRTLLPTLALAVIGALTGCSTVGQTDALRAAERAAENAGFTVADSSYIALSGVVRLTIQIDDCPSTIDMSYLDGELHYPADTYREVNSEAAVRDTSGFDEDCQSDGLVIK